MAEGATGTRSWTLSVSGNAAMAMFAINAPSEVVRYVPDMPAMYDGATLMASKTGIRFRVVAGHGLNGNILGSGTNGTTNASGIFVLPEAVTLSDQGEPVAASDPVTVKLWWQEGSDPTITYSTVFETTLIDPEA
jgi:hypothetical protein